MSMPAGFTTDGLPVGMDLLGTAVERADAAEGGVRLRAPGRAAAATEDDAAAHRAMSVSGRWEHALAGVRIRADGAHGREPGTFGGAGRALRV